MDRDAERATCAEGISQCEIMADFARRDTLSLNCHENIRLLLGKEGRALFPDN